MQCLRIPCLQGNKYLHKKFLSINVQKSYDDNNFTELCNVFHNETPLIVIENSFLLVLTNIAKIACILFCLMSLTTGFVMSKGLIYEKLCKIRIHVLRSIVIS